MSFDDIAIRVSNLSKCYNIYSKPQDRLKQSIYSRLQHLVNKAPKRYFREFWALKDVSFEIKKGETVGIIGRNGSGKSTLLQLICGTLNPTGGDIQTNGRIAALLELGSGFNPEFTGRENVYMNAALLGLSKEETDARFDEIMAFADIGDFVEQPVKTYSSGMIVRLAFSVAINVEPKILIVDEALSVGDELFQRKCFSRIEAIRSSGATILFVSHSGGQIVELCDRAMLMEAGQKVVIGVPKQVVGGYQKMLCAPAHQRNIICEQLRKLGQVSSPQANHDGAPQNPAQEQNADEPEADYDPTLIPNSTIYYEPLGALIENARILTLQGKQVNNLIRGQRYRYAYDVTFTKSANGVHFGMLIKTTTGIELGGAISSTFVGGSIHRVDAQRRYRVEFQFSARLNPGVYFMNAGVIGSNEVVGDGYLHRMVDAAMFRVMPEHNNHATAIVDFDCVPEIELIG